MFNKKFILEKIIYLAVLGGAVFSFFYFEENLLLKIIALVLVLLGLADVLKKKENLTGSNFELLNLIILYLGFFSLYNLLYGINLPLYVAMVIFLIFVNVLLLSVLIIDGIDKLLGKKLFLIFILLTGLAMVEIFLSLYFWPIDPGIKSLILVIAFYQVFNLVYLYAHSMLRLSKIRGYLLINILILATIFLSIWLKLT